MENPVRRNNEPSIPFENWRLNKPIILSTGMSTLDEIKNAVTVLKQNGAVDITVLHCTTEYPAPYRDVNLRAMLR